MKFRKKPIVVEAYQLTEEKEIHTREGTVKGYPGDWIITGIQGEVYPCGKEIFEQTYEPADTRTSRPAPSPDCMKCTKAADGYCLGKEEGAAQAREDLLDEIIEWATPIRKNWPNNDCHRDPFDDIIKKAESLRTEGGEPR